MRTVIYPLTAGTSNEGGRIKQARMTKLEVATENFSFKDQNDKTFDLYENIGKRTILSFHPITWTEYCAAQMMSLEENRAVLSSLNTEGVGISVDSRPCKRAWAETLRIKEPRLLCDFWPHG